jgi:hypothetical protein
MFPVHNPNVQAIKSHLHSLFDSKVSLNYLLSQLRPGRFHIYTGTGNTGLTVFANHLIGALAHMRPWSISSNDLLTAPLTNLKTASLLLASNWDTRLEIPAGRMLELLRAGHLVILCAQSLPTVRGVSEELMNASVVYKFPDIKDPRIFTSPPNEGLVNEYLLEKIMFAREVIPTIPPSLKNLLKSVFPEALAPAPALVSTVAPSMLMPESNHKNTIEYAPKFSEIQIHIKCVDTKNLADSFTVGVDPDSNGFIVKLIQPLLKSTAITYISSTEELERYFHLYFTAASKSIDSHETVCFTVPYFPRVTIPLKKAKKYLGDFTMQVNWLCEDWPVLVD